MPAGGADNLLPFPMVVRQRLFDVDIFFGLTGPNGRQSVPVVAGGDDEDIDGFIVEDLAKVLDGLRGLVGHLGDRAGGFLGAVLIDVTDVDDLDALLLSERLRQVLQDVQQVGPADTTVLILGETGTGKELFARAVHAASRRRDQPLVKVNCAAIPATLIESEFFGHERGAFTGATARRDGRSVIYAAQYEKMNALIAFLTENCCGDAAAAGLVHVVPDRSAARPARG